MHEQVRRLRQRIIANNDAQHSGQHFGFKGFDYTKNIRLSDLLWFCYSSQLPEGHICMRQKSLPIYTIKTEFWEFPPFTRRSHSFIYFSANEPLQIRAAVQATISLIVHPHKVKRLVASSAWNFSILLRSSFDLVKQEHSSGLESVKVPHLCASVEDKTRRSIATNLSGLFIFSVTFTCLGFSDRLPPSPWTGSMGCRCICAPRSGCHSSDSRQFARIFGPNITRFTTCELR